MSLPINVRTETITVPSVTKGNVLIIGLPTDGSYGDGLVAIDENGTVADAVDLLNESAVGVHLLGSADHTADTLANLNAKVSDATLIDTADSRLSDARTPLVHALGGAEHSADTLVNLNSKISDATLIDTADSRLSDDRTASGLRTSTTVVVISGAAAPSVGQALIATGGAAATWQDLGLASGASGAIQISDGAGSFASDDTDFSWNTSTQVFTLNPSSMSSPGAFTWTHGGILQHLSAAGSGIVPLAAVRSLSGGESSGVFREAFHVRTSSTNSFPNMGPAIAFVVSDQLGIDDVALIAGTSAKTNGGSSQDGRLRLYTATSGTLLIGLEIDENQDVTIPNGSLAVSGGRSKTAKGANVASAGIMTLGTDGNFFDVTGTTTINEIVGTDWTAGTVIVLRFSGALTVTHNSGGTNDILLNGAVNFSATAGDLLPLIFDGTDWNQIAPASVI